MKSEQTLKRKKEEKSKGQTLMKILNGQVRRKYVIRKTKPKKNIYF